MRLSIGFLGGGQIASALAGGFRSTDEGRAFDLAVFDRYPTTSAAFAQRFEARECAQVTDLVASTQVIFLCVKPQDVATALQEIPQTEWAERLLISVAAGIHLSKLSSLAGREARICRAMPNTAAEVQRSATAVCFTENCQEQDRARARDLFAAVGEVLDLPEKLFDAVVGVSGSGPAYACLLIEAMSDGGVAAGLPRPEATRLAALAVRGAAELILTTGRHPAELREKISSPAGTTIAALHALEMGAVRAHAAAAVLAAARRSAETGAA